LFSFFNLHYYTFAQNDTTYFNYEDILEELVAETDEDSDNSELFDRFEFFISNPVDLNTADTYELLKIPFIDISTVEVILNHRKKFGLFFSAQELFAIHELPKDVINKILPFVTVAKKPVNISEQEPEDKYSFPDPTDFQINLRSRILTDLQTRRGFTENRYTGSKIKNYNRLTVRKDKKYQIGILTEKDPGELSFNDFTSYHLSAKKMGIINSLVLGDYVLEFGQGLALWSAYPISKGTQAIYPSKKNSRGVKPYTSSTEYGFLRGAAATLDLNSILITAFYSSNKFDAGIDTVSRFIMSRPIDGYHRTETEISRKNTAEEDIIGGIIQLKPIRGIDLGVLAYNVNLSNPLFSNTIYDLSGDELKYYSFFYDAVISGMNFFGEFSYDQNSVASINGLHFSVTKDFSIITSFRNYPRNYSNYLGSGFGERAGVTSNELGFYTGFRWKNPLGILNVYYDQFNFPYKTFTNVSPSNGDELLLELHSRPFPNTETKVKYKYEDKDVTQTIVDLRQMTKRLKQSVRFELINIISKTVRLKSRAEFSHFKIAGSSSDEDGILLFQDIRFSPVNEFVLYGRFIFFNTDSFNSAVYEFENDLRGMMLNLPMYGEGLRWYLMCRYKFINKMSISIKYSQTYKPRESSLSSGNNLIPGNLDNRVSLQLDMNF
jgi:hypothetical protein